jgi:Protein of unknown function (DUF3631)
MMILDEVRSAIAKYCILPDDESYDAVALWIAASHAQPAWETATRLCIKAPAKQCGKSRLLDMVDAMCWSPQMAASMSPAALIASIDDDEPPTILMDEVDTIFTGAGSNESFGGLLNAGHQRGRPYVRVRAGHKVSQPTFAMAALAGIGNMPDTIEDRAVIINMRRRGPGELVSPYRRKRDEGPLRNLGFHLQAWVRDGLEWLKTHEPVNPLEDRPADNWEPLLAVADLAGGTWPERARKAAVQLDKAAAETRTATTAEKLLSDLRAVFTTLKALGESKIPSEELCEALKRTDREKWEDVEPRLLGRMLQPYGIRPKVMRFGDKTLHGYEASMFNDTFARYLKPER